MLLLFETPAGFALMKVLKEDKLKQVDNLWQDFESLESAEKIVKLKAWTKFDNTVEALSAATSIVDSKLPKSLKKFLKKHVKDDVLGVLDAKLGNIIKDKLGIECTAGNAIMELARGVRNQLSGLVKQLDTHDMRTMSLGLSHSLSRYKLKFSPDKVDTMVVQAIGLLDDLDKELNTYAMRVREWYGWHFPEMTKIVADNIQYAKCIKLMGFRDQAANCDFSAVPLDEHIESALKEAAVISMGTEISDEDIGNIKELCDQVISLSEYRGQLFDYLKSRMSALAPNLTVLVGEMVGARLIAHAGTLLNLAKQPASTIQILGAEKALFRALKTKNQTPKYGLIYHASLIGQAAAKSKGKIARVLAAKCAISVRVDALGDATDAAVGIDARGKVEQRLRMLDGKQLGDDSATPIRSEPAKYDKAAAVAGGKRHATAAAYGGDADVMMEDAGKKKKKKAAADGAEENGAVAAAETGEKKKKKTKKAGAAEDGADDDAAAAEAEAPKKKKAKRAAAEVAAEPAADADEQKPKKKKKKQKADE